MTFTASVVVLACAAFWRVSQSRKSSHVPRISSPFQREMRTHALLQSGAKICCGPGIRTVGTVRYGRLCTVRTVRALPVWSKLPPADILRKIRDGARGSKKLALPATLEAAPKQKRGGKVFCRYPKPTAVVRCSLGYYTVGYRQYR
jgi:hypothetical protein